MPEKPTYEELEQRVQELQKKIERSAHEQAQSTLDALIKSEERFRLIAESSIDDIWQLDMEGNVTYTSPAKTRIFGYSEEEARQMRFEDFIARDRLDDVVAACMNAVMEKKSHLMETIGIRKDGSRVPIEVAVSPIIKADELVGVQGVARDITERKKAEERLKKRNEFIETILDSLPIGLAVNKISDNTITYVNRKFQEIYGWPAAAITDADDFFQKVYPGQDALKERVLTDLLSGDPARMMWRDLTATGMNGQKRIVTAINIALPDQDLMISTVQDESQRHHAVKDLKEAEAERLALESQLRQVQKIDSLGTLAGGIAHDFNNILFPIIGFAEMMLLDSDGNTRQSDHLNRILAAARRGSDLTRQILSFSRQSDQDIKPMDIRTVVLEVLKLIRPTLPTTIRITHALDEHCGPVMADATQIHQVIMNLMTNAYHAMLDTGGLLDIRLDKKEFTVNEPQHPSINPAPYVCLTVSDTGVGMDQAVMERIFDPYFTTKEKYRGTGLGLALVHSIVKAHDGHIRVRSTPGKGTAFEIYLPMLDRVSPEANTEFRPDLQKGEEHILVVDDEENIVFIEQMILEKLGYRVTAKTGSREALDLFSANPFDFDLVISDMTMPYMTGFQLARELLALRNDLPIIICTGFSDTVDEKKTKEIGVKAFLMKPIEVQTLSDTVRAVLDDHV